MMHTPGDIQDQNLSSHPRPYVFCMFATAYLENEMPLDKDIYLIRGSVTNFCNA